jgi:endonuclease IV
MFGFHVNREWAIGARPSISAHVDAARAFSRSGFVKGGVARPFAFQVFVAGPRNMKFTTPVEEAHELRTVITAANAEGGAVWGVAHGTFMDHPWSPEKPNHAWTLKWIRKELRRAASAGLAGLVIHLGVAPVEKVVPILWKMTPEDPRLRPRPGEAPVKAIGGGEEIAADSEADAEDAALPYWHCYIRSNASCRMAAQPVVPPVAQPDCVRIYLEVPSVLPKNSHYETPEKLCHLFRTIRAKVDPGLIYYGLCIDTAHIWASGADISSFAKAADWLERLEHCHDVIPPHAIMFHLNDNRNPLGSGADEHDCLLQGAIWGDYAQCPEKSGLAAFLDYARRFNIPTILERKGRKGAPAGSPCAKTRGALDADLKVLAQFEPV